VRHRSLPKLSNGPKPKVRPAISTPIEQWYSFFVFGVVAAAWYVKDDKEGYLDMMAVKCVAPLVVVAQNLLQLG
jgi:hypothetical protein